MQDSVVRNIEAPTPSLREQAEDRRQRVKFSGWCLICLLGLLGVYREMYSTLGDVLGSVAEMSASPRGVGGVSMAERFGKDMGSLIASTKLPTLTGEATAGLESWRSTRATGGGGAENEAAAARLLWELEEFHQSVGELQDSLAKSRSVGTVTGVATWDLEKKMDDLDKDQKALLNKIHEVHEFAHLMVKDRRREEKRVTSDTPERQDRIQKLRDTLKDRVEALGIEELHAQLAEVERQVGTAVLAEEAEAMVMRFSHKARAAAGGGPGLASANGPSDEEIEGIAREVVRSAEAPPASGRCVTIGLARNLTRSELQRYGADKTGIPDYAMGPAGARIIPSLTSETYAPAITLVDRIRSKGRKEALRPVVGPPVAINPESQLGRCWPVKGAIGDLTVKLSQTIRVEKISIEHAARVLLLNSGSPAPKAFSVVGYPKGWVLGSGAQGDDLVTNGEYALEGDVVQYFDIAEEFRGVEYVAVGLHVESNHGEAAFTCLYRFRVHGTPSQES